MKNSDQTIAQHAQVWTEPDMVPQQVIERYWQTLRHAQNLPARNDIDPNRFDSALPHSFIIQRVAPCVARFRFAGSCLQDLIKLDPRGMPISVLFLPDARGQLGDLVETAFAEPAIISIPLTSPVSAQRSAMTGSMLLLPLSDYKGHTTRILGAFTTSGEAGTRPRRFEIAPAVRIRQCNLGIKLASFSETGRGSHECKGPDALRPALRLVVNNC